MKIMSKSIEAYPSMNLTKLVTPFPSIILSTMVYRTEKNPPVKSRIMLKMLQPIVDFRM